MNAAELRVRIARWEDLHTDFKVELGTPGELAKDLVCFANTDGGQIVVRDFEVLFTIPRPARPLSVPPAS